MTTVEAVRDRILQLCEQRNMSINKLASVSALPPSSVKNILYGKKSKPQAADHQDALRWAGHHAGRVF